MISNKKNVGYFIPLHVSPYFLSTLLTLYFTIPSRSSKVKGGCILVRSEYIVSWVSSGSHSPNLWTFDVAEICSFSNESFSRKYHLIRTVTDQNSCLNTMSLIVKVPFSWRYTVCVRTDFSRIAALRLYRCKRETKSYEFWEE